ncbi:MAG: flavodoxin family protein, partial [Fusobacteriaceae bacterium]
MKTVIVYSSKTGNTKKVADSINEAINESEVKSCKENLEKEYDLYILGGWIDRGTFDSGMLKFIENIKEKKVAYFFTLGAEPDSKHAQDCRENIETLLLENGNEVLGSFCCQGAI